MTLDDLLKRIPSDTEERVARAKERYNQRVREVAQAGNWAAPQTQVRISLLPGLSEALRKKQPPPEFALAVLLGPWRGLFIELRDSSAQTLKEIIPLIIRQPARWTHGGPANGLEPVNELAKRLLAEAPQRHKAGFQADQCMIILVHSFGS